MVHTAIGQPTSRSEDRLNIVFIIADDLNTTLECFGVPGVHTPNLDALASRALRFERAYSQSPLCNPSRASMMTGRRPHTLGIWNNDPHFRGIYPRITTLPQYFKDQGYHTVGLGKIYHNWAQSIEGDPESWSEPQKFHWAAHYQDWYVPARPYRVHEDLRKDASTQQFDLPDEAYLDGRIANAAVNKLHELQETNFFLAIGFWKPHLPYNAPKKYWDLYDPENLPSVKYPDKVDGLSDLVYVDSDEARSYTDIDRNGPLSEAKKEQLRHGYLASISYLDAQVGKVLDAINKLELGKNTIIIFTSDHGYHAGEHGQFGKWTNFEVGARVPLMISGPGATTGTTTASIVELVDLYPTLLELCMLPRPAAYDQLDGVSLVPILNDPAVEVKSMAISQIARPLGGVEKLEIIGSSIRNDHFRYNSWDRLSDGKRVYEELYHLTDDVHDATNVVDERRYKTAKQQLSEKLEESLLFKYRE